MKTCTKCGQTKKIKEFYLEKAKRKDGSIREFRRSHCRACEKKRKSKRDRRTKEERANQHLLNKYGLTTELREIGIFNALINNMLTLRDNGNCIICCRRGHKIITMVS